MNDLIEKNDCTDVVLSDNVKNLIDNTLSENTKRSYATAFKKFESLGGVLPCNAIMTPSEAALPSNLATTSAS